MTYIVSNIKCDPAKVRQQFGDGDKHDEFVFLNLANNYELFKDVAGKKVLICSVHGFTPEGIWSVLPQDERHIYVQKRYNTRKEWYGREHGLFDKFGLVIDLDHDNGTHFYPQFQYPLGMWPTTGFLVYSFLKYLRKPATLINFFPVSDHTTDHWGAHDWVYEQSVYDREKPRILDLR